MNQYGLWLKVAARGVAAIICTITAVAFVSTDGNVALVALFAGLTTAALLWSVISSNGVRIAAQGQHLLAALDLAVHTSPFLSDQERAQAMSLNVPSRTRTAVSPSNGQAGSPGKGDDPVDDQPFCYHCGAEVPAGSATCASCGQSL
jgi:hypothetical protein